MGITSYVVVCFFCKTEPHEKLLQSYIFILLTDLQVIYPSCLFKRLFILIHIIIEIIRCGSFHLVNMT